VATPDLQRLAAHVTRRRLDLNLSVKRAASIAHMSKDTWVRVERGDAVQHLTYGKVEAALGWAVGSCRKIRSDGEAVLLDESAGKSGIVAVPPETLEIEVRDAVQGAMIAATDTPTASEIRKVNEHVIGILRARGILPPES
jgi:hypothetical protein